MCPSPEGSRPHQRCRGRVSSPACARAVIAATPAGAASTIKTSGAGHAVSDDLPVPDIARVGPGWERDVPLPEPGEDDGGPPLALVRTEVADTQPAPLVRTLADLLRDPDALKPPEAVVPRLV
jgi:hypothetical protein